MSVTVYDHRFTGQSILRKWYIWRYSLNKNNSLSSLPLIIDVEQLLWHSLSTFPPWIHVIELLTVVCLCIRTVLYTLNEERIRVTDCLIKTAAKRSFILWASFFSTITIKICLKYLLPTVIHILYEQFFWENIQNQVTCIGHSE